MKQLPEFLYHATPASNLPSIREHGLSGHFTRARPGLVHLAVDLHTAIGYIGHQGAGDAIVLAVRLSKLDERQLRPDREDLMDLLDGSDSPRRWDEHSWKESLELCGQCTTSQVIAPGQLRVVYVHLESGVSMLANELLRDFEMPRPTRRRMRA